MINVSIPRNPKWLTNLAGNDRNFIAFLVFLNIAAYNAALTGFKNLSLFWTGLILFVFAAFFHVYRYSMGKAKNAPPPLPPSIQERPLGDQLDTKETPELADPDKPDDKTPKE